MWNIDKDIENIFNNGIDLWSELQDANIFLTGGTGFIGTWILKTIEKLNADMHLNIRVTILTRNIQKYKEKNIETNSKKNFTFLEGDICNFRYPNSNFSHIIHGATDASAHLNENDPKKMYSTIVDGTKNLLEFSLKNDNPKILFMSSGAVYGNQPIDLLNVPESYVGAPITTNVVNCYAEAKRAAEMLCAIYCKQENLNIKTSRIFALLGPYLSLDIHFAAGNFIKNAIDGNDIIVHGNGKPIRSYLYPTDLIIWLFFILLKGKKNTPYNVGSPNGYSIEELARKIADLIGNKNVKILGRDDGGWNLGRYVPDVSLITKESNYKCTVSIDDAIKRTASWNKYEN